MPNVSSTSGLRKALANPHVQQLLELVAPTSGVMRFSRVLVLSDADADGQHARVLLNTFFIRHLPTLVAGQIVFNVYPPAYQIYDRVQQKARFSWSQARPDVDTRLTDITYFKGLASMPPTALWQTCVDADRRTNPPVMVQIPDKVLGGLCIDNSG